MGIVGGGLRLAHVPAGLHNRSRPGDAAISWVPRLFFIGRPAADLPSEHLSGVESCGPEAEPRSARPSPSGST